MSLFNELSKILPEGVDLNLTIRNKGASVIVSIIPKSQKLEDSAKNEIKPLVISGTPAELDQGFVAAIYSPIEKSTGLLVNMQEYEKSVKDAESKSKAEKEKKDKEKKEADNRKKKLDKLLEKADEQEKEKDYRNAIKTITSALEFSSDSSKLQKRITELKGKLNENSLFNQGRE